MNEIDKQKLFYAIGLEIVNELKMKLIENKSIDTSAGISGIRFRVEGDSIIVSMPEHLKYVEFGRLPGKMPPVEALEGWAERKLGDKDLAWPIAIKIEKEGIEPRPFIRPTLDKVPEIIQRNLSH